MNNNLDRRRYIIAAIIIAVCLIFVGRLFYIQVIDKSYMLSAENNSRRYVVKYPARGVVYDRKGKLVVYNETAYDVMVILGQIKDLDSTAFERALNLERKQLRFLFRKAHNEKGGKYRPKTFLKQISALDYARFQELLFKFPGFYVQARTVRTYPHHTAAHVLGYVGEVDSSVIKKNPYYTIGDYIGVSGIEQSYEKYLRGKKGGEFYNVDVQGKIKGHFANGVYDSSAVVGQNIVSTLDIDLQDYGEQLMKNKKGSIIAIEPSTGEILCLISAPTYDPNLLVGRPRAHNMDSLRKDSLIPLFNRAVMAQYPPGSTFKPFNALLALQHGIIDPDHSIACARGYHTGSFHVACHPHPGPVDLLHAIQVSCNAYFCTIFRDYLDSRQFTSTHQAYQIWHDEMSSFGFGQKLGTDIRNELKGNLPSKKYYDKIYGTNRWRSLTIISLSIGQGEVSTTPLHMVNAVSTIANRGWFVTPHLIKKIEGDEVPPNLMVRRYSKVDSKHYDLIVEGMSQVMSQPWGTAHWTQIPDIEMCGKTGTAQNPHGKDHSIFMGFAPKNNPKIAIVVYVENAGFGAVWAAPIASCMIEKYLTDTVKRHWFEKRILDANLLHGSNEGDSGED